LENTNELFIGDLSVFQIGVFQWPFSKCRITKLISYLNHIIAMLFQDNIL